MEFHTAPLVYFLPGERMRRIDVEERERMGRKGKGRERIEERRGEERRGEEKREERSEERREGKWGSKATSSNSPHVYNYSTIFHTL